MAVIDPVNVLAQTVAMGMEILKDDLVLGRIASRRYQQNFQTQQKGNTIQVPIPQAITATDVVPGPTPPAGTVTEITHRPITLDQWIETRFTMDDDDLALVAHGAVVPNQLKAAIYGLSERIESHLWSVIVEGIGTATGTAGTTPFSGANGYSTFLAANRLYKDNRGISGGTRYMVVNTAAEQNVLDLPAFQRADQRGDSGTHFRSGSMGYAGGAEWICSQTVAEHNQNTLSGYRVNQSDHAAGDSTLAVDGGTGTIQPGDQFLVADAGGHHYVVSEVSGSTLTYAPTAKEAFADNKTVTFQGDYVSNVLIHQDCLAVATAALGSSNTEGMGMEARHEQAIMDPDTGLTLRVEYVREHRRETWAFDVLFGAAILRPEFGVKVYG